jgi:hypothetical protein
MVVRGSKGIKGIKGIRGIRDIKGIRGIRDIKGIRGIRVSWKEKGKEEGKTVILCVQLVDRTFSRKKNKILSLTLESWTCPVAHHSFLLWMTASVDSSVDSNFSTAKPPQCRQLEHSFSHMLATMRATVSHKP